MAAIFDVETMYAGAMPMCHNISSMCFTDAGEILEDKGYGPQRDAGTMLDEIGKQLGYMGHLIFITFGDITVQLGRSDYLNFCFGVARDSNVVISMRRFMHLPIGEQKMILAGLIMHEVGHIYNFAIYGRN